MSVDCIRIGAVRLCLALMLGLVVVPGYVVAPVLFAKAGSISLAGSLAGNVFHLTNIGFLFLTAAVTVFWLRMRKTGTHAGRVRWSLLLLGILFIATNEFGIAPVIADLKMQIGPMDQLADDDPQRKLFGIWHGVSALLHLFAAISAAVLVSLGAKDACQKQLAKESCPS
ncbi:MAG: DUF4149 domain-containing protein [Mariprofundus sp.]